MYMLRDLLEDDRQRWMGDVYTAQTLAAIASAMGMEVAPYTEFVGLTKPDTRSGQEIIDDLIAELDEREKRRKEGK